MDPKDIKIGMLVRVLVPASQGAVTRRVLAMSGGLWHLKDISPNPISMWCRPEHFEPWDPIGHKREIALDKYNALKRAEETQWKTGWSGLLRLNDTGHPLVTGLIPTAKEWGFVSVGIAWALYDAQMKLGTDLAHSLSSWEPPPNPEDPLREELIDTLKEFDESLPLDEMADKIMEIVLRHHE
jgi:hypothetical protein